MTARHALPSGFEDLQALVAPWALPTEPERYARRLATPLQQLREFYDALHPRMDAALRHLAGVSAADARAVNAADRNLFYLTLAFFEASHPIELHWKSQDLLDAFPAERITYTGPSSLSD